MSTVSSNGELNRLSDGASPYPAIQSAYSAGVMPSGTSALTAVKPIAWKSRNASSNTSRVLPPFSQYGMGLAAILFVCSVIAGPPAARCARTRTPR